MADKKISELVSITGSATAADDYFVVVDTSGAVTYKISREELNNAIEQDVLENISITNLTSDLNTNGNDINFGDNDKAIFGAGSDLQIYHDGADSFVKESGTGNLNLASNGTGVHIVNDTDNETMATFHKNGASTLYYDNAAKLATTATGVDVTGTVVTDGFELNTLAIGGDTFGVVKSANNTAAGFDLFGDSSGTKGARVYYEGNGNLFTIAENTSGTIEPRLVIDDSGFVGIGTSSPSRLLSLNSTNASIDFSNGTWTNEIINSAGQMEFRADHTSAAASSVITFSVDGSEAMRLDSSNRILCGTTDTDVFNNTSGNGINIKGSAGAIEIANTSGETLYLNRMGTDGRVVNIRKSGTFIGGIDVTTSAVSYNTSSDYRLKTAVNYDWDATTRLKQLRPARFEWIVDGDDAVPVDGFLAHEVQDVVPEAISGTKDAMRDEEYTVSAATGDIYTPAIDAVLDEDGNEVTPAVAEVIHSTDAERPEELAEGQQWRETTAAVMGTRSVPDYQGIDQSKLVPLLVKTIQELEARITALEA